MPRKRPQTIVPTDLYRVRMPGEIQFSPRARHFVTTVSRIDEESLKTYCELWIGEAGGAGGPDSEIRPFTFGKHSDRHPRWSPDGTRIAFLSDRSGKTEIWIIQVDGGEARPLTELKGSISSFDWHPNGRRLVAAFRPADPEAKALEEAKKQGKPGADAMKVRSIDRLVYKMDGAGFLPRPRTHLWTIDARTGKAKPLLEEDRFDEGDPRYSPDGRWIYFVSRRGADPDLDMLRDDIWRIPARGGDVEKVKTFAGPSTRPSLSPDGRWMAFLGRPNGEGPWNQHHEKLYLTPAAGGRPQELTERLDRACENSTIGDVFDDAASNKPMWSPDSRWIYFTVVNEGNAEVWRTSVQGGQAGSGSARGARVPAAPPRPEPVIQDPGVVLDFAIDFEAGWIHYVWADPTNPGEVRSRPLPDPASSRGPRGNGPGAHSRGSGFVPEESAVRRPPSGVRVRSRLNVDWLADRQVSLPQELWYEGKGGHALQGWVLYPPKYDRRRKYPGLLYIHGGPATQYGRAFFHEFQFLAGKGYIVFYTNPRGGTGYSESHLNAIVERWGTRDYDDLMRFTDVVLRKHRAIDRRRVGVAGGSYGGFMTNWIIGHTQRFKCAITQRCLSNLLSFVGASDFGFMWPREFGAGSPWENAAHYLKMSPLTYLSNMKTPTLIEHQEEDHRCPIDQAEQLWSALRSKGVPCSFVRYPQEPHGMSRSGRPDRRIDRLERIEAWLGQWLG